MAVGAEGDGLIVSDGKTFSVQGSARPEGGLWRCGVHWVQEVAVHDGFTAAQVEQLKAERKLADIQVVDSDPKRRDAAAKAESVESLKAQIAELEKQLEEATKPAPKGKPEGKAADAPKGKPSK